MLQYNTGYKTWLDLTSLKGKSPAGPLDQLHSAKVAPLESHPARLAVCRDSCAEDGAHQSQLAVCQETWVEAELFRVRIMTARDNSLGGSKARLWLQGRGREGLRALATIMFGESL